MDDITKNKVKAILIDSGIHEPESLALIEAVAVAVHAVAGQKNAEFEENIRQATSSAETLPSRIDEAGKRFGQVLSEAATPVAQGLGKVEVVVQRQLSDIDKKLEQAASKKVDSVTAVWADAAHKEVQKHLKNEGKRSVLIWGIAGAAMAVAMMVAGGLIWNIAIKSGSVYECQTFHEELWCRVRN
ncbi:hypothetical protein [Halothiobacillus neapolitanus]|uniref:Uncharacterized protein n=1 Tax=Halothiobacillus neapolitanus (strain ATCC 23641 / DSM 15147 / CIP 104769 / NCIMB 8539 / c2) TaxID=555778 RepID=D0KZA3_HALNC|nr:hypothetical protein [Halothiobacillus neapolitanus]ACX95776.1 hypothetical protein Hneap_0934 [Halothiobacillus neapolitanus c2]TDN66084.1 hypothetical protein C8D83_101405 [Halothiobacillus neapolitanus]